MKIQNPFRLGLLAGLGVLVALLLGGAVASLTSIITYVGAALFLSLGLDPLVTYLEKRGLPRWAALLTTLVVVIGAFVGVVFAVVPTIVAQASRLIAQITDYLQSVSFGQFVANVQTLVPVDVFDVQVAVDDGIAFITDPGNITAITGGVLQAAVAIGNGIFGAIIVLILTLYFTSSLNSLKRGLYQLVPASKRAKFADLTEQISQSVGRFVVGQVTLALCNGILSFIYLSIIGAELPAVFAFIAFLFSLVPLVGTISGSVIIVLAQVLLLPDSQATWFAAGIYYLIYMQVEAYLLSPNIMNRAVKIPGAVVVIAALVGGTLLGVLGALIAIPVAASILLIIKQVVIPRQNEL
ncbi:AI-2E family transporter [Planctomonas psychrotolerans]|uniref:AI-2E family transporter n=1 Tax=Planctomonas psychrotolerans TaxID=2528712 RepID=UPI00123C0DBD|nr:AI-2E family transporter [Planctomonas psychrotolerans]